MKTGELLDLHGAAKMHIGRQARLYRPGNRSLDAWSPQPTPSSSLMQLVLAAAPGIVAQALR